ncbi:MAG: hypothetical protein ACFE7R_05160 [Candidatus Hodarchaeota archaeon]
MLKEVFLIDRGVLQFHYGSDKQASDDDKAVLSSGFLSAIQDFSTHARSDILQSFETENEYFKFLQCPESSKILVGVFDRRAPETLAGDAMEKAMAILRDVDMPEIEGMQLPIEKKDEIRERIEQINIQLFSNEQLSSIVVDLLSQRTDIPLAFLVDSTDNSVITSFSRPKPLFKDTQVREHLLLHSTISKTFENFDIEQPYSYFIAESDDYAVVACNGGRLLSVASGAMRTPTKDVYDAATTMCYAESFDAISELSMEGHTQGEYILKGDGKIDQLDGIGLNPKRQIFLSTLVKNVESLFTAMTKRPFSRFYVRTKGEQTWGIIISREKSGFDIRLLRY